MKNLKKKNMTNVLLKFKPVFIHADILNSVTSLGGLNFQGID